jgi:transcriptional regulator with XRE-family HTH domain
MLFDPGLLRRRAGISQRAMAELMQLHQPTISRIESGVRRLTLEETIAWAHHCGHQIFVAPVEGVNALPDDDLELVGQLAGVLPVLGPGEKATLRVLLSAWQASKGT